MMIQSDTYRNIRKHKWKVDPAWRDFCNTIVESQAHIIACARGKAQFLIDGEKGKQTVRKMGVGADMRDGFDYEFTVSFNIDQLSHNATVDKDNTHIFESRNVDSELTERDGEAIIKWANSSDALNMSSIKREESEVSEATELAIDDSTSLKDYITRIKNVVDSTLDGCADDESKNIMRGIIANKIKQFVKNDVGKPVADYRLVKDVNTAKSILVALDSIKEGNV